VTEQQTVPPYLAEVFAAVCQLQDGSTCPFSDCRFCQRTNFIRRVM
jgi:hypothetical protein